MSVNVLVTGGTGFLGRRLVDGLLNEDVQIRCLVRRSSDLSALKALTSRQRTGRLEIVEGELSSPTALRKLLGGIEVVYHLAASLSGSTASMFQGSVIPTRFLAQASVDANVKRFVLVSSLGVYGAAGLRNGSLLDESSPVDPHPEWRDPYSFSKIRQEHVAWEFAREQGLPLVVVRPGVIYGPGRPLLTSRVGLSVGPWLIRMGGSQRLPYTYVENCADAILRAGFAAGVENQIFNVIDDDLPTGRAVLRALRRHGRPIRSLWIPRPLITPLAALYGWYADWSQGQLPAVLTSYKAGSMWKPLRYSNAKAKELLQWCPQVSIEEGFRRTLGAVT